MLPLEYAIRNLFREPGRVLQKVAGASLVLFLVLTAAAFSRGMSQLLEASGAERNVLFLGAGSEESVERSQIAMQAEEMIRAGVRGIDTASGQPAVSGEVHYNGLVQASGGTAQQALCRGVTPMALEVHRSLRIVAGNWPRPGEVMVGRLAHHLLGVPASALAVGESLTFEGETFRIAGQFTAPGTVLESEIWFLRTDLMTLIQRETLSCVVVRLEAGADTGRATLFAKQRLDLELTALSEEDYYGGLARFFAPVRGMAWLTAAMVGLGALMGGLNTLYAAFASRIREVGTLQTLGYRRSALLLSFIQESLVIQALGLVLALYAWLFLLDGRMVQFSMGTFALEMDASGLAMVFLTALLMGTLGTLPPALKCLRPPVPEALRSN
jgi:putative ABC transport system permease protein